MYYEFCPFCGTKNSDNRQCCAHCNRNLTIPETDEILGDPAPERRESGIARLWHRIRSSRVGTAAEAARAPFVINGTTLTKYRGPDSCIEVPVGVVTIGAEAFQGNHDLVSVKIPDGVKVIDNRAFCGCPNLVEVELPDTLLAIGDFAFAGCGKLANIFIPRSVSHIGVHAFPIPGITLHCEIDARPAGWHDWWNRYTIGGSTARFAHVLWNETR